jgi:hypothetical protein
MTHYAYFTYFARHHGYCRLFDLTNRTQSGQIILFRPAELNGYPNIRVIKDRAKKYQTNALKINMYNVLQTH